MTGLLNFAHDLDAAQQQARAIPQLSSSAQLTTEEAYAVQKALVGLRLARGERRAGVKMGFTSRAKMLQMGLSDLIWGRLTDAMRVEDGGAIDPARFVHPRVEPEIAFLLKRPVEGPVSPAEAMAAVEAVAPALEVIDSRYADFKFDLGDVIADNTSAAGFVLGPWSSPDGDLSNLGMILELDGRLAQIGSSAAILGHPARALAAAARVSAAAGERLEAGWIVMAGAATAAEPLRPGIAVRVVVQQLGSAGFSVGPRG